MLHIFYLSFDFCMTGLAAFYERNIAGAMPRGAELVCWDFGESGKRTRKLGEMTDHACDKRLTSSAWQTDMAPAGRLDIQGAVTL
jgi:hypothetical protein